jgi:hypothetical protein
MHGCNAMQRYQPIADSQPPARPFQRPLAYRPRAHDAVVAACDVAALEYFVGKTTPGRLPFESAMARRFDDPDDRRDRRADPTREETPT